MSNPAPLCRLVTFTTLGHKLPSFGYSETGARRMISRAHPSVCRVELHRPDGTVVLFVREGQTLKESAL